MLRTESATSRVFFHTPRSNTRGYIPSVANFPAGDLTLCLWVRSNDPVGAMFGYSSNTTGLDFALYSDQADSGSAGSYVPHTPTHTHRPCRVAVVVLHERS